MNGTFGRRSGRGQAPSNACGLGNQITSGPFEEGSFIPNRKDDKMASRKTLDDAFHDTLKDVLFAERTSVRALKKAAKAAQLPDLKQALEQHVEESEGQIERLQQVFEEIGKSARGKTCESIQGLMAELEDHLEEFKGSDAADAVLIAGTQAMEHYEIARYGTLKTWAAQLGLKDAVKLIDQTLEEEKKTDDLLNQVAQKANQAAQQ